MLPNYYFIISDKKTGNYLRKNPLIELALIELAASPHEPL